MQASNKFGSLGKALSTLENIYIPVTAMVPCFQRMQSNVLKLLVHLVAFL